MFDFVVFNSKIIEGRAKSREWFSERQKAERKRGKSASALRLRKWIEEANCQPKLRPKNTYSLEYIFLSTSVMEAVLWAIPSSPQRQSRQSVYFVWRRRLIARTWPEKFTLSGTNGPDAKRCEGTCDAIWKPRDRANVLIHKYCHFSSCGIWPELIWDGNSWHSPSSMIWQTICQQTCVPINLKCHFWNIFDNYDYFVT